MKKKFVFVFGFNSKLVRLKVMRFFRLKTLLCRFNSQLVRLKALLRSENLSKFICFNSKLVRLKVEKSIFCARLLFRFNSKLVRLKAFQKRHKNMQFFCIYQIFLVKILKQKNVDAQSLKKHRTSTSL